MEPELFPLRIQVEALDGESINTATNVRVTLTGNKDVVFDIITAGIDEGFDVAGLGFGESGGGN